jgi:uncharacterized membrane protein YoaK (UPF0700 family)
MIAFKNLLPGLMLTAVGGFIDAVGFIQLGGFFTSFMSGNTTELGVGLAHIGPYEIFLPFLLLLLFFIGGFAGSLLSLRNKRHTVTHVLGLTLALLILAAVFSAHSPHYAITLLAAAMGAQNAVLTPVGSVRRGATFITGTLFTSAQDLARAVYGQVPAWRFTQNLMVWAVLAAGAVSGALADNFLGLYSLYVPALVIGAMFLYSLRRPDFFKE